MTKWLLLAVVVVGVLWWLGRGRGRGPDGAAGQAGAARGDAASRKATPAKQEPEPMVACAHCGLLLPKSDALAGPGDERLYCSEAHRRAGPG